MPKRKLLVDVGWRQLRRIAQRSAPLTESLTDESSPSCIENPESACELQNENVCFDPSPNLGERSMQGGKRAVRKDLEDNIGGDILLDDQSYYDDAQNAKTVQEQDAECGLTEQAGEEANVRKSFLRRLADWSCRFKINLNALTALLLILRWLRPDFNFPRDGRTVVGTPRATITREVAPGRYWHRGLKIGLIQLIGDSEGSGLDLSINVDGLPIAESSNSSVWPILCSVKGMGVFVVGIYHGYEKPEDPNCYLEDLVWEMNQLIDNGLHHNRKAIAVKLRCLICDAPAKSFVMCTKSHTASHGCSKCWVEGNYLNKRMSFLNINAQFRMDEDFRAKKDEDYHKKESIMLSTHGFQPVTNVVLDYTHLVCEGVVKKMLLAWLQGKVKEQGKVRLSAAKIRQLDDAMLRVSGFIPKEFARHARSFKYVKQWKATEFRQFVLYTGPAVLKDILSNEAYDHFMLLHVAITLLVDKTYCENHLLVDYANTLLRDFVVKYKQLHGKEHVSHNVHTLIHLASDVKKYGSLDEFFSFPFESFLYKLKCQLRKCEKPLEQIMRRYIEEEKSLIKDPEESLEVRFFTDGCVGNVGTLPPDCVGPRYMRTEISSFILNIEDDADNCCYLKDGQLVQIENLAFLRETGEPVALRRILKKRGSFYRYPCDSAKLGIVVVRKKGSLTCWPLSQICQKCVKLPFGRFDQHKYAVFPLLHATA